MMKSLLRIAAPALLTLAACSDFATAPDRVPAAFELSPDSVLLMEGETVTFEYTVLDENGEAYGTLPAWASPLWTFSEDSVLDVDPAGLAHALGPGRVEGTARLGGMEAGAVVRVNPAEMRVSVAFAHITQSTQRRTGDVPLVTDRDGLLRVYLRGDKPNFFTPQVRATFQRGDSVVHTVVLEMEEVGLPRDLDEGDLNLSFDALIPASVLQPGTGMVVEVDPEGMIPASSSSVLRVPATGVRALDIVDLPPFRVRLVPVNQSQNGLESRFTVENAMDRLEDTRDMFPIGDMDVDVRAPYTTDADLTTESGWLQLIEEVWTLRGDDGSSRYYYGGFQLPRGTNILGLGYVGWPTAIGTDASAGTLAHELGHNLGLPHAPCGGPADPDPNYPYAGGFIGQYGYDLRFQLLVEPAARYDLMTYCNPVWISDYNYEKVVEFRATSSFESPAAEDVLVVHAGVLNGEPHLAPALRLNAPAVLPSRAGPYTLEGRDADGATVFTLRFEPRPLDHGDNALFSAAIPVSVAQPDRLASLRLTGPEGTVERLRGPGPPPGITLEDPSARGGAAAVRWDAEAYPLAVVRDRATGQIVAMSRSGRVAVPDPETVDVTLSDGVRSHPAELRQR